MKIIRRKGISGGRVYVKETPQEGTEERTLPQNAGLDEAQRFMNQETEFLEQYAETRNFYVGYGRDWYFDPGTRRINADPSWFVREHGYQKSEAVFASCHEIEHLRFLLKDPQGWLNREARTKGKRRLHVLYNGLLDVHDNRTVCQRALGLAGVPTRLYSEKLFPEKDMTGDPKHIQFVDAILREAMVPEEQCNVDPEVRRRIDELKHYQGENVLNLLTDPTIKPSLFYHVMQQIIEPVFDGLYQEDLKDKRQQKGGGEGSGEMGEEAFSKDYDKADKRRIPKPLSPEDEEDIAGKATRGEVGGDERKPKPKEPEEGWDESEDKGGGDKPKEGGDEGGISSEGGFGAGEIKDRLDKAYELEHGVSMTDVNRYNRAYRRIEPHIQRMREVFEKIIEQRIEWKSRLSTLRTSGPLIEPGLVGVAEIARKQGVGKVRVFRSFERQPKPVTLPTEFEVTSVRDRTGSMEGPKKIRQRDCAILETEGLREFAEKCLEKKGEMDPDLSVKSEGRAFTDTKTDVEYKKLGPLLAEDRRKYEQTRIGMFKLLSTCPGKATYDFASLEHILEHLTNEQKAKLASKTLKKAVIFTTDGVSSDPPRMKKAIQKAKDLGIVVKAVGLITKESAEERHAFKALWGDDGLLCDKVDDLPEIETKLLCELMGGLNQPIQEGV